MNNRKVDLSEFTGRDLKLVERIFAPDRLFITTDQLIEREKTIGDCNSKLYKFEQEKRSRILKNFDVMQTFKSYLK